HDDALSSLLRGIRDMELDDSALAELAHDVSGLRQKLPAEILTGEDSFDPSNPQQLQVILEDIKELLVNRLLATGKI
ncbi:MAG: DNA repair exonuclease, partial [Ignavibacteria bacterium]|nr:DNA repair exonuclease [Ignavibacteria bacterium]